MANSASLVGSSTCLSSIVCYSDSEESEDVMTA